MHFPSLELEYQQPCFTDELTKTCGWEGICLSRAALSGQNQAPHSLNPLLNDTGSPAHGGLETSVGNRLMASTRVSLPIAGILD